MNKYLEKIAEKKLPFSAYSNDTEITKDRIGYATRSALVGAGANVAVGGVLDRISDVANKARKSRTFINNRHLLNAKLGGAVGLGLAAITAGKKIKDTEKK